MKIPVFVNNVNIDIIKQEELDRLDFSAPHPCRPTCQSADQEADRLIKEFNNPTK